MTESHVVHGRDDPRSAVRWCSPRLVRLSGAGLADGGIDGYLTEGGHRIFAGQISEILVTDGSAPVS